MTIDWTQVLVALIAALIGGGISGIGVWKYAITKARLDSKKELSIPGEWQRIVDALLSVVTALQQYGIADRQALKDEISSLKTEVSEIRTESMATITALRADQEMTVTALRNDLREALEKINALYRVVEQLKQQIIDMGGKPRV